MTQPEKPYEHYCNLHREFIEEYRTISTRVVGLYQLPKKFIEDNAVAMDRYMAESSVPGAPGSADESLRGLKEFIFRIEDFKQQIMGVFFEHRTMIEKSTDYMKKVQELKGHMFEQGNEEKFVELIPELTSLRFRLKCIEERASGMISQLESIEGKWNSINGKMAA